MLKIKLPNGLYLTAEEGEYPGEMFIGISDENGRWLQDLAIIRNAYNYDAASFDPDKMEVLVYADSEDDDYTDKFEINFWKGAE